MIKTTIVIKNKNKFKKNLGKVYFLIAPSSTNKNIYLAHEVRPNGKTKIVALDLTKVLKERL